MIPDYVSANFQTLLRAAENGDLALMECTDIHSEAPRYIIAAVQRGDKKDCDSTPFGHLAEGNPFEAYRPPE
ncbi:MULTISPECIES: DUF6117 family protein [Rhodospirillales]|uniref:DUF6117 family protein n=1 Tax=Rhodospirillales TaxID=204441 RepID=UPI002AC932BB|nr:DUF6117 family protein [Thalassobaculum sp. OXR-137]WPZ35836.1 DUF6117 family protein [Thalassobaculum sp. OXR-137]